MTAYFKLVFTANCLWATDTNVQVVTSLVADTQTSFLLQWDTSLGAKETNVWMSVVTTGLMCTISYTSANHLPCTYQPEWCYWCQSVCYYSSRNSFIFWWRYIGINPLNAKLNPICHLLVLLGGATIVVVSRLRVKVMVNVAKTLICYEQTQLPILMNHCSREWRLSNNTTANWSVRWLSG